MVNRLGLFTRLLPDRPESTAATLYSQAREQFLLAEQLGYDVGWVAQHHFDVEEGGLPSPLIFLAWMAAQTRRIRLGTGIVTMAFENPVRVAEDAAVLDVVSGGRLELGLGTGGGDALFAAFGGSPEDRNVLFADNFRMLIAALSGAGIDAQHRSMHPPGLRVLDDLWQATFSATGGARAGAASCGLLLSRTQPRPAENPIRPLHEMQRPIVDAYLAALPAGPPPRVGASRSVFALRDGARAKDLAQQGIARHADFLRRNKLPVPNTFDVHAGTAAEVIDSLAADPVAIAANDLIVQVHPVDPPGDDVLESIELIATEVAPALGWRSTNPARV
jgi:putative FMN-dependent luciferase-like monooxygenase